MKLNPPPTRKEKRDESIDMCVLRLLCFFFILQGKVRQLTWGQIVNEEKKEMGLFGGGEDINGKGKRRRKMENGQDGGVR